MSSGPRRRFYGLAPGLTSGYGLGVRPVECRDRQRINSRAGARGVRDLLSQTGVQPRAGGEQRWSGIARKLREVGAVDLVRDLRVVRVQCDHDRLWTRDIQPKKYC